MTGKIGLRGRLMLAIVPIALLAVCAAALAVFSFQITEQQQKVVAEEAIPALISGQELSAFSDAVTGMARRVTTAQSEAQLENTTKALGMIENRMNDQIAELARYDIDGEILNSFSQQTGKMINNINSLSDIMKSRFDTQKTRQLIMSDIIRAVNEIESITISASDMANSNLENNLSQLYGLVRNPEKTKEVFQTLNTLRGEDAPTTKNMLELRAVALKIPALARMTFTASSPEELDKIKNLSTPLIPQMQSGSDEIPTDEDSETARSSVETIANGLTSNGSNNLFNLRQNEFVSEALLTDLLTQTTETSQQMAQTAQQLLEDMRAKINDANQGVTTTIGIAKNIMIGVATAALIISALIIWLYVQRNLLARLIGLNVAMDRLTKGDLETPVTDHGSDEIADMASAVELFRENAKEAERLREGNKAAEIRAEQQRREALLEMANGFESSVNGLVTELLSQVGDMRDAADNMAHNAGDNVHRAIEVSEASQNASQNVSSVSSATEELSASIAEIERQVSKAEEVSRAAVSEARKSDETVRQMSDTANRIGEVIELITTIADQTNLLALNATIEAARAGDAGKGFAVVANEVKNLASQTQRATEDIGKQIEEMRSVSSEAVEMISTIARTIGEIDTISSSIAAAMRQQGAATAEIASGSEEAANGVRHVSENMLNVSRAAEAVQDLSGSTRNTAEELLQKAHRLQDEANSFVARVRAG
ncbi:methyl-accepting chemotaxis protein [Thalassospira xiamenensis]|uniref:methyl-accepting chemotaxis protein n=1 Tax=Thalassospira xiamenensis TaxID=220697 RepID=UPI0015F0B7A8|nr:methyl-accepting chemotaxis protein [Thalassospira xiamenensis]